MKTRLINSTDFHEQLYRADQEAANLMQAQNCQWCGGKLHQANYPRIAFGLPSELSSLYSKRFSFCCATCRRRSAPPSLRFFGRRRYAAVIFVLLSALRSSPSEQRCNRIARYFNLHTSLATWKRWLSWWRVKFPSTALWVSFKASFTLSGYSTPNTLLTQFTGKHLPQRLMQILKFLSPLTSNAI